MIHLFDIWKSVGYFRDRWCFFTERCCCTVRQKVSPHRNSFKTTQNQTAFLAVDNCKSIYEYKNDPMSCYHIPRCGKIPRDSDLEMPLSELYANGEISEKDVVVLREQRHICSRNTFISKKGATRYAKFKIGNSWQYVKVERLIHVEVNNCSKLLMKFQRVNIEHDWIKAYSKKIGICSIF